MKYLRTASTRRLLGTITGLLIALAAGTAIAVATVGSGPVPGPKPLAQAIHDALAAPPVSGISARITFTNRLISSADLQGSDPILNGASGRVWISPAAHRVRVELQGDNGDAQIVLDNRSFWVSDPSSHTVYEGTLPADSTPSGARPGQGVPTVAKIATALRRLAVHLNITGARRTDVGGQGAYSVSVSPRMHTGLLGFVELAWDAKYGTPLRFTVTAKGSSDPVLQLTASHVSFDPIPASVFAIMPPTNAKVAHVTIPSSGKRDRPSAKRHAHDRRGPVTARGQGLDAIAIIKERAGSAGAARAASRTRQAAGDHGEQPGLSLPTVQISPGVSGQELQTALGTAVRFTRGGFTYIVIGSQPPANVLAVARTL